MNNKRNQLLEAGFRGEELSLKGIIVPGELDALFDMTSVQFSSDLELDFIVERDAKGDELMDHLRKLIRVKGFIREDEKGRKTIRITDYKILQREERGMKAVKNRIRDRGPG